MTKLDSDLAAKIANAMGEAAFGSALGTMAAALQNSGTTEAEADSLVLTSMNIYIASAFAYYALAYDEPDEVMEKMQNILISQLHSGDMITMAKVIHGESRFAMMEKGPHKPGNA